VFISGIYIILLTHTETLAVKHVQRVVRSMAYKCELYRSISQFWTNNLWEITSPPYNNDYGQL